LLGRDREREGLETEEDGERGREGGRERGREKKRGKDVEYPKLERRTSA
jgi:hypothetical protein